jgi:hypothetical protein
MKNKYLLLLPLEKKQQRSAAENATGESVYLHGSTQHAEYAAHITSQFAFITTQKFLTSCSLKSDKPSVGAGPADKTSFLRALSRWLKMRLNNKFLLVKAARTRL